MIYAVGQANSQSESQSPRLIDIRWGNPDAPKVTLVGKGVCFDTGGLNMKSSAGMKLMKKDMGGSAQVLGLAKMIMQLKVPVALRVLIPAVENSISGNSTRPSDVLTARQGTTVEIGNTDAEGRLVLADALTAASSESPDLLVDCATLTGAARVAVGSEIAALFCNDDEVTQALMQAGQAQDDPLWPLPLHEPYRAMLESKIADLNNISSTSYGGSITAALFLREFVQGQKSWVHIDFMAYNLRALPGRPEGGEAMGMRALFAMIQQRFGTLDAAADE
ncbi:MAG: leucyl aminopeptidase family protein, partial [Cyanobacteria bacterium J06598_1]